MSIDNVTGRGFEAPASAGREICGGEQLHPEGSLRSFGAYNSAFEIALMQTLRKLQTWAPSSKAAPREGDCLNISGSDDLLTY